MSKKKMNGKKKLDARLRKHGIVIFDPYFNLDFLKNLLQCRGYRNIQLLHSTEAVLDHVFLNQHSTRIVIFGSDARIEDRDFLRDRVLRDNKYLIFCHSISTANLNYHETILNGVHAELLRVDLRRNNSSENVESPKKQVNLKSVFNDLRMRVVAALIAMLIVASTANAWEKAVEFGQNVLPVILRGMYAY